MADQGTPPETGGLEPPPDRQDQPLLGVSDIKKEKQEDSSVQEQTSTEKAGLQEESPDLHEVGLSSTSGAAVVISKESIEATGEVSVPEERGLTTPVTESLGEPTGESVSQQPSDAPPQQTTAADGSVILSLPEGAQALPSGGLTFQVDHMDLWLLLVLLVLRLQYLQYHLFHLFLLSNL